MKLRSTTAAALVFGLIFGTIIVSSTFSLWQTETTKVPARFADGEASGQYNPADIRGSYTIGEVSALFQIPLADLQAAYDLPAEDPGSVALKELEERFEHLGFELGTGSVHLFTALYKNLPYDLSLADDYLLKSGAEILKAKANLSAEQLAYLETHTVDPQQTVAEPTAAATAGPSTTEPGDTLTRSGTPMGTGPAASGSNASPAAEHTPEPGSVTGKTSFGDLLDWGVPQKEIEALIGQSLPLRSMLLKDWVASKGLSFTEYRAKFQALIDALP